MCLIDYHMFLLLIFFFIFFLTRSSCVPQKFRNFFQNLLKPKFRGNFRLRQFVFLQARRSSTSSSDPYIRHFQHYLQLDKLARAELQSRRGRRQIDIDAHVEFERRHCCWSEATGI